MLKAWKSPEATVFAARIDYSQTEKDYGPEQHLYAERTESDGDFEIGKALTGEQQQQWSDIVLDFPEVFSVVPGCTQAAEHVINTRDAPPVRSVPRRLPKAWETKVLNEVQEMLEAGVIEPCTGPWSSQIVPVRKSDGSVCVCIDYRDVNAITVEDPYPMPRIEELLERLGDARFISTFDLAKGYYQVPVNPNDKDKTAFMSKLGKYRFTKMPFGLRNAPATFQRLMDHVLAGMQEYAAAYMDDIVIHSDTWEHHVQHLRALMTTLKQHGLTVKNKKCQIGMTTCKYLGHVVGNGTISPQQSKIESIETFKTPQIKKDVHAFLGLAGYYRRFLPNFSTIAAPLSDLTKNIAPNRVEWTDKCERAFQTLKQALAAQPILATPDYSKGFILQTDASEQGIGALSQQDDDRGDRPLAFFFTEVVGPWAQLLNSGKRVPCNCCSTQTLWSVSAWQDVYGANWS